MQRIIKQQPRGESTMTEKSAYPTTDPTPAASEPTEPARKRYLCRHIHTSGRRCGSPALTFQGPS